MLGAGRRQGRPGQAWTHRCSPVKTVGSEWILDDILATNQQALLLGQMLWVEDGKNLEGTVDC